VGLNEDETVAKYLEASQEAPPDTRVIAQQHASIHSDRRPEASHFPFVPVLVLVAVAAGGVGGWRVYQDRKHEREQAANASAATSSSAAGGVQQSAASPVQQASAPQPGAEQMGNATLNAKPSSAPPVQAASTQSQPAVKPQTGAEAAAGSPFEITIRPKDRAWVAVKSDGRYVVRGIIQPPDVRVIRATDQLVFYTGNAGAVTVSFGGKDVPLSGGPNQEQVLVFNSHGLVPKAPAQ
jgi:hypothetical protein